MIVAHFLRGYDKETEFEAVTWPDPPHVLPLPRSILAPPADDQGLMLPYELPADSVQAFARVLVAEVDPDAYDYYLESSDVLMTPGFHDVDAPT